MKITIVTGFFLPVPAIRGGATEKIWHRMAQLFAEAGHEVTFISRSWPGLRQHEVDGGITHRRLRGFGHTRFLPLNLVLDFIWGLKVTLALPKADALICNTVSLPIWIRYLRPSVGRVCVVMGRAPKGQLAFYRAVQRIYAPSNALAGLIGARFPASRVRVIGNPIDWSRIASSAASGQKRPASPVTLGFVGRVHPEKGIALLVAAAGLLAHRQGLPEWRLRIVGPHRVEEGGGGQQWYDGIRSEAETRLGGRVEWVGPEYDQQVLAQIYGGMHVFCYPSLADRGETFGVAVAEAMAAGCAVVVSGLACFADLVDAGKTGLVFDHRAGQADSRLADCLELLVRDEGIRATLADSGRAFARRFEFESVTKTVLDDLAFLTGSGHESR